ncbi:protoporphyrinogen/coproporphyrinogen oxidase [Pyrobaculum neutrophilum]|uniref:protoporphyrinogen/coproporphyrinogen oxidase n=1 Tax=Pyrobaculum neutrophilum TaxID=70771 RepID=UPI000323A0BD|nr:FAD-dependent oxidoreductase [Pyrobaculum neutrophilum]
MRGVRRAFVYFRGRFVPYPFENGLWVLEPGDRAEALVSFMETWMGRSGEWRPSNLREWVYGFFGRWLADNYLAPYNEKIWKRPLEEIDVDWVYIPGRLPVPDWRDVARSAAGVETVGYREQSVFYYPASGGIQALYDGALKRALASGSEVAWGVEVRELRRVGGRWVVNGRYEAEVVVATIPLPRLVEAVASPTPPEEVYRAVGRLDWNAVAVVGVALEGPAPDQHWVYVPDRGVVFHRYAWISNYSPANAPPGRSAVIAEVTIPKGRPVDLEKIKGEVLEGFERLGILEGRRVLFTEAWLHPFGYPVYTRGHREAREVVQRWLEEVGIFTAGRWGAWHYWNMDKVYTNAKQTAEKIEKIKLGEIQ